MIRALPAAAAVLAAPLLAGCATAVISPSARPWAAAPSAGLPAIAVTAPAGDFPLDYHGLGATHAARSTQPLNDFLRDAVAARLAAMGFPAATPAQAQGVLSVSFTKARLSARMAGAIEAAVEVRAELRDRSGRTPWTAGLSAEGRERTDTPGMPGSAPELAFNQALNAALDDFASKFRPSEITQLLGAPQ